MERDSIRLLSLFYWGNSPSEIYRVNGVLQMNKSDDSNKIDQLKEEHGVKEIYEIVVPVELGDGETELKAYLKKYSFNDLERFLISTSEGDYEKKAEGLYRLWNDLVLEADELLEDEEYKQYALESLEEIIQFKKVSFKREHPNAGALYVVTVSINETETKTCKIKYPSIGSLLAATNQQRPLLAKKQLFEKLWVEGDEEIKTDNDLLISVCVQLDNLSKRKKVVVKKK